MHLSPPRPPLHLQPRLRRFEARSCASRPYGFAPSRESRTTELLAGGTRERVSPSRKYAGGAITAPFPEPLLTRLGAALGPRSGSHSKAVINLTLGVRCKTWVRVPLSSSGRPPRKVWRHILSRRRSPRRWRRWGQSQADRRREWSAKAQTRVRRAHLAAMSPSRGRAIRP